MKEEYKIPLYDLKTEYKKKINMQPQEESSNLVTVLDEITPEEAIDEPVPEIIDACCCPCIKPISPGPFCVFCPLQ